MFPENLRFLGMLVATIYILNLKGKRVLTRYKTGISSYEEDSY